MGKNGSKWMHGWIPQNAAASRLKRHGRPAPTSQTHNLPYIRSTKDRKGHALYAFHGGRYKRVGTARTNRATQTHLFLGHTPRRTR